VLVARSGEPYPLGVAEAILLAVEPFLGQETAAELAMLDLLSVLSPEGVSLDLLDTGDDLLHALYEASLVEFAGSSGDVVVRHRLTQRGLRGRVDHALPLVVERAADLLDAASIPDRDAWRRRDRGDELVRHIEALWEHGRACRLPASDTEQIVELRLWAVRHL